MEKVLTAQLTGGSSLGWLTESQQKATPDDTMAAVDPS